MTSDRSHSAAVRCVRALAWLLVLSVLPVMTAQTGDEEKTDPQDQPDPRAAKLEFSAKALYFRTLAMDDVAGAVKKLGFDPQALDVILSSPGQQADPLLWSYFFSTTIVLIGNLDSPAPVVAYYSPFVDAAVITKWNQAEFESKLQEVRLVTGRSFVEREAPREEDHPLWLVSKELPPIALVQQYKKFVIEFQKRYPPFGKDDADLKNKAEDSAVARGVIEAQCLLSIANLHAANMTEGEGALSGVLAKLEKVLGEGKQETLDALLPAGNVAPAESLALIPSEIRKGALPAYAIHGENKSVVFLLEPQLPRFFLVAEYDLKPAAELASLAFFDFETEKPLPAAKQ